MSKVSLSIGLDEPVVRALDALKGRLEQYAVDTLPEGVNMPVGYSRSKVVQMCILSACKQHGVEVDWRKLECASNNDAGDSGNSEPGPVAGTDGSSS